jgi:arabinofuranosyltransferase
MATAPEAPTEAPERESPRMRQAMLGALLLAACQLARLSHAGHAVDDAWISFRVARNLVQHGVLSYGLEGAPVEGMTNLSWTLLSATWIGLAPGLDPIIPARLLGAVLLLATVVLVGRMAAGLAREAGGTTWIAAGVAAGLLAASGSTVGHAISGLETPLWGFLVALSLERAAAARHSQRAAVHAGLVLGLLALTRPEAALFGGLLCLAMLGCGWRRAAAAALPFAATIGALEIFRLTYYGQLLPNTFYAKPPWIGGGVSYLQDFALLGLGGLGILAVVPGLQRSRPLRALLLLGLAMALATAATGGDWMLGHRRLTITTITLVIAAGVGASLATGAWRWIVGSALACWLAGNAWAAAQELDVAWYEPTTMARVGDIIQQSPEVDLVAAIDIGRLGWSYQGEILDLAGLTDAHIAHMQLPEAGEGADKGGHMTRWDPAYFEARDPDLVVATITLPGGLSDPLTGLPDLRSGVERALIYHVLDEHRFRMYNAWPASDDLHVLVFARLDLDLPREIWGPPAPKGLRQLLVERMVREKERGL